MIMTIIDKKFLTAVTTLAFVLDITLCGEYPAGLDPRSCPNYPNCDNAVLHGLNGVVENSRRFENRWDSGNSWNPSSTASLATAAGSWNSKPLSAPARYPASVDPRSCPSYPNCDNAALHRTRNAFATRSGSRSSLSWNERHTQERISYAGRNWNVETNSNAVSNRYPPGINAQNCPDYPYC